MTDDREKGEAELLPVPREHLLATLSFALTRDSRLAKTQAADVMSQVVAERLVERLEEIGFVVMRRPGRGHTP